MKTVGIVVEYNPFHNGHAYHLAQIKKQTGAECLVAIMSGPFVQRGEPAIVNKWARTEMALRGGIDLVIELPFLYATQSAEWFAYGAVATLHATGVIDGLSFGMESEDPDWLMPLAEFLEQEPPSFRQAIKEDLSCGLSYPAAFARALATLQDSSLKDMPAQERVKPNNILALHYCRALLRLHSSIKPLPVVRKGAEHHQQDAGGGKIASATSLRKILYHEHLEKVIPYVPQTTYEILKREKTEGRFPVELESFFPYLLHQLIAMEPSELEKIHEMKEGIHHLLGKIGVEAINYQQLIQQMGNKRYTHSRIRRLLLNVLMNVTRERVTRCNLNSPSYIRILGFTEKGKKLLKTMRKTASLPLIHSIKKERNILLNFDLQASRLYGFAYPNLQHREKEMQREFRQPPLQL
ncbi:MAG TPA: nucleotidyltransferase [Paenibacillaceae bacterium]|mgnify:CR=1 FL=1|nr:nucleotidyltransferase [Paenibacillaceae bacterium]